MKNKASFSSQSSVNQFINRNVIGTSQEFRSSLEKDQMKKHRASVALARRLTTCGYSFQKLTSLLQQNQRLQSHSKNSSVDHSSRKKNQYYNFTDKNFKHYLKKLGKEGQEKLDTSLSRPMLATATANKRLAKSSSMKQEVGQAIKGEKHMTPAQSQ